MKRLGTAILLALGGLLIGATATHASSYPQTTYVFNYHNPLSLPDPNEYAVQLSIFYPSGEIGTERGYLCGPLVTPTVPCVDGQSYVKTSQYVGYPEQICWGTVDAAYPHAFHAFACQDVNGGGTYTEDYTYLGT